MMEFQYFEPLGKKFGMRYHTSALIGKDVAETRTQKESGFHHNILDFFVNLVDKQIVDYWKCNQLYSPYVSTILTITILTFLLTTV